MTRPTSRRCTLTQTLLSAGISVFLFCVFHSGITHAAAGLQSFPNSLILQDADRNGTITVINNGDSTGLYAVEWVDNVMMPNGKLKRLQPGEHKYSLKPHIRYAPRRMLLKPGQLQTIKLSVKRGNNVQDREYYSHLLIKTLDDNVEKTQFKAAQDAAGVEQKAEIRARQGFALPIIWRKGDYNVSAELLSTSIAEKENAIALSIRKSGPYSIRGEISIVSKATGTQLVEAQPFYIYADLEIKTDNVKLLEGINSRALQGQEVTIRFSGRGDNKEHLYFETDTVIRAAEQ